MSMMSGWGWTIGIGSMMVMILLVVLVLWLTRQPPGPGSGDDEEKALRILDQRFARGEIDEHEYARRREVLEKSRP
jgi:putative membrane protein